LNIVMKLFALAIGRHRPRKQAKCAKWLTSRSIKNFRLSDVLISGYSVLLSRSVREITMDKVT